MRPEHEPIMANLQAAEVLLVLEGSSVVLNVETWVSFVTSNSV